jgi:hypothetical protein
VYQLWAAVENVADCTGAGMGYTGAMRFASLLLVWGMACEPVAAPGPFTWNDPYGAQGMNPPYVVGATIHGRVLVPQEKKRPPWDHGVPRQVVSSDDAVMKVVKSSATSESGGEGVDFSLETVGPGMALLHALDDRGEELAHVQVSAELPTRMLVLDPGLVNYFSDETQATVDTLRILTNTPTFLDIHWLGQSGLLHGAPAAAVSRGHCSPSLIPVQVQPASNGVMGHQGHLLRVVCTDPSPDLFSVQVPGGPFSLAVEVSEAPASLEIGVLESGSHGRWVVTGKDAAGNALVSGLAQAAVVSGPPYYLTEPGGWVVGPDVATVQATVGNLWAQANIHVVATNAPLEPLNMGTCLSLGTPSAATVMLLAWVLWRRRARRAVAQ